KILKLEPGIRQRLANGLGETVATHRHIWVVSGGLDCRAETQDGRLDLRRSDQLRAGDQRYRRGFPGDDSLFVMIGAERRAIAEPKQRTSVEPRVGGHHDA